MSNTMTWPHPDSDCFHTDLFGNNVFIFSPEDDPEKINEAIRFIENKQTPAHFTDDRYALFFKPGTYDSVNINVGFFTQAAGLGLRPTDTKINKITCTALWKPDGNINDGLANFWRTAENLEIKEDALWAVSQASPMRRVKINKNLFLHEQNGYTSGGFLCDSLIKGFADHGPQQQWFTRNSQMDSVKTYGWNQVFMGSEIEHKPEGSWPEIPVTLIDTVEEMQEKPFLIFDNEKGYGIFVPQKRVHSHGVSWNGKEVPGRFIPLCECYIAKPEKDSSATINDALEKGLHLIFTPGIYRLEHPVYVSHENTIVLGLGLATLTPTGREECMITADVPGIIIAGLLFDAGPLMSDNLLVIGSRENVGNKHPMENENNLCHQQPTAVLSDLFFRIGGFKSSVPPKVKNCLEINSDHVIGDNLWIWRADHYDQVGWDKNTALTGIIVNGSHVSMYALMVEHFMEYQTIWNGEYGRIYMYQSEFPYDVPDQEAWMSHNHAKKGYASLKVSDHVKNFQSWCAGMYSYHRDAPVICHSAAEVPDQPEVILHHTFDVYLNGYAGISHVINESGQPLSENRRQVKIVTYNNGICEGIY